MERLCKKEDEQIIAWIKRFMEYETLIPGFHEEEAKDPVAALEKYGFPLRAEDVSFYPTKPDERLMRPVFADSAAPKYAQFMENKLRYRDELKEKCIPSNPAMKKWHKRQKGRCMAELGARTDALIHVPFTIELSDGCSVGCPFCGLSAGKLQGVFEYNEENARLFKDSLLQIKELIGDAAGQGTMYFASEPLDNPDYESFLKIFKEVFSNIPQITTATALKNSSRLHELLKEINKEGKQIYRFSILSEAIAKKVFEEYSPEELLYTELLPQFEGAPGSAFANSGRMAAKNDEYDNTISCVSGFVVNYANRTVRLTTPTVSSKKYPTGEIILERRPFTDADDLLKNMKELISIHMSNIISPKDRVRLKDGLTYRIEGQDVIVENSKGVRFTINAKEQIKLFEQMMAIFNEGYHTKREIVAQLIGNYEGAVMTDTFHYSINRLWELGILQLESGKI